MFHLKSENVAVKSESGSSRKLQYWNSLTMLLHIGYLVERRLLEKISFPLKNTCPMGGILTRTLSSSLSLSKTNEFFHNSNCCRQHFIPACLSSPFDTRTKHYYFRYTLYAIFDWLTGKKCKRRPRNTILLRHIPITTKKWPGNVWKGIFFIDAGFRRS